MVPQEKLSIILTAVSVIISVVSMTIAFFSFRESRQTRKSIKQPLLVLVNAFNELTITNIGNALAFNISVYFKRFNLESIIEEGNIQWANSYLLPCETTSQKISNGAGDFESIEISINFESVYKEKHQMKYKVNQNLRGEGRSIELIKAKTI